MAAEYDDIIAVREIFTPIAKEQEETFKEMLERVLSIQTIVDEKVAQLAEGKHTLHDVGFHLDTLPTPIQQLQAIRKSIYKLAEIVNYFRIELFPKTRSIENDCKALYLNLWTEIIGNPEVICRLRTNVDKERETEYILRVLKSITTKVHTTYIHVRSMYDWVTENLDALNKMESSLRLEHNMRATYGDVGNNSGERVGSDGVDSDLGGSRTQHDPRSQGFDELVDGDLTEADL